MDAPVWIKVFIGWIIGAVGYSLGGWDFPLQMLLMAQLLDTAFGIGAAIKTGEGFKPRKLAGGWAVKVGYWGLVAIAVSIDQYLSFKGMDTKMAIHEATVFALFAADIVSAVANAAICGVPVPTPLTGAITRLKELANEIPASLSKQPGP